MYLAGEVTNDWSAFNPRDYLEEYYGAVGPENLALMAFFVKAFRGVSAESTLLDFGSGPTIYSFITAAALVAEIHVCDYLPANLAEIGRWLQGESSAWEWTTFVKTALRLENGRDGLDNCRIEKREGIIRKRVSRLCECDARKCPPIGEPRNYDVVTTNFCAESATEDVSEWRMMVKNIASVLKPGGRLITAALEGARSYSVGRKVFPAVTIDRLTLREALIDAGLEIIIVDSVPADRPRRKYGGIMFALATKSC